MFHEPSDKFLVTVRIDNAVSMAVFIINWHVGILVSQKRLINWQMDAPEREGLRSLFWRDTTAERRATEIV